jgi:osmoprotectant transport system substrate-binding protein
VKRNRLFLLLGLIAPLVLANPGQSCVGRSLTLAITNSQDQVIMGHMLSVLINERTGTTVNIVELGDVSTCHETVLEGKADIYISYIGKGLETTEGSTPAGDSQKIYILVSQRYLEKFRMVWLKPFGFRGPLTQGANAKAVGSLAAPIVTKDVLKRFPVLDRVINKLGGIVDNDTLEDLRQKAENQNVRETVRAFLKTKNMI